MEDTEQRVTGNEVGQMERSTSKSGLIFSKLFRLDRTDPFSFRPKFPEILVEWIALKDSLSVQICVTVIFSEGYDNENLNNVHRHENEF